MTCHITTCHCPWLIAWKYKNDNVNHNDDENEINNYNANHM